MDRPLVQTQCICPNNHEADDRGLIVTNPSCVMHCVLSRYVRKPYVPEDNCRVYGKTHSGVKL